jgi:hypothetical protein
VGRFSRFGLFLSSQESPGKSSASVFGILPAGKMSEKPNPEPLPDDTKCCSLRLVSLIRGIILPSGKISPKTEAKNSSD